MGVNLFGGKFYKCVDARGVKYDASVVANKTACLERGDRWINSNVNFDNSGNGFLALLQVVRINSPRSQENCQFEISICQ